MCLYLYLILIFVSLVYEVVQILKGLPDPNNKAKLTGYILLFDEWAKEEVKS